MYLYSSVFIYLTAFDCIMRSSLCKCIMRSLLHFISNNITIRVQYNECLAQIFWFFPWTSLHSGLFFSVSIFWCRYVTTWEKIDFCLFSIVAAQIPRFSFQFSMSDHRFVISNNNFKRWSSFFQKGNALRTILCTITMSLSYFKIWSRKCRPA